MQKPCDSPILILASKSPRRRYLLEQAGLCFSVIPSNFNEKSVSLSQPETYIPETYVKVLAEKKAYDVSKRYPESWVIGADTIVLIGNTILGKPGSKAEAKSMLKCLGGQVHQVLTGYCICCEAKNKGFSETIKTEVLFKNLTDEEIEWYINTKEPFDKAGAYAIQGLGTFLVKSINGSYTNVVGLPVCEVIEFLIKEGVIEGQRSEVGEQMIENDQSLKKRLENIIDRIKTAALSYKRKPETIRLVAVSKTIPADRVREAINAGVNILGENYIQEAREKFNALSSYNVSWHFIGHLQTNKAKYAVRLFDLIHTVDSLKLALELNKQSKKINKIQQILIQINIGRESSKSGVYKQDALKLIKEISGLENLAVKGLMTMPPFFDNPEKVRPYFSALRNLRDHIKEEAVENVSMEELSMGMTGDFEAAIEEGATLVRIGTAIFGKRN